MLPRVALASLLLLTAAAPDDAPAQLAGLFMQACVMQPNAHAMRNWAAEQKLKQLPGQAQDAFLGGEPGVAFDASNPAGKFVLAVRDNSNCAVFAEHAQADPLIASLESSLTQAGASFKPEADQADPQEQTLHERTYELTLGGQPYTMLVGTSDNGGRAMVGLALRQ
jgi:hypothetical protein